MTANEWIEKAKERIGWHRETISEVNEMSSRDCYWGEAKSRAERAARDIKFLQAGIALLESKGN